MPPLYKNSAFTMQDLLPSIVAGIINAIVCIVSAVALAALIFTGPLAEYLPQGIGILLLGTAIFAALSAATGSHPLIFHGLQDIPIAILALISTTVAAGVGSQMTAAELYQFIVVVIGLTSFLTGLFFFVLGRFKLGRMVRFIPFPVVGGFLAGTGWLIVEFSFTMMTDIDLNLTNILMMFQGEVFFHWFPGVIFALLMIVATRQMTHYLLVPGIVFGGIALFYVVMFAQGLTYADLEHHGYLLSPFPEGGLWPGLPLGHVPQFRWDIFISYLPTIATMMVLCAISLLFNYSGLEILLKQDFDLDKELRLTGYNNMLAGLAGSTAGYMTLSETSMAYNLGARSRLPSIIVALLSVMTLVFGAGVLAAVPTVILGGLLLNLGLEFLVAWLIDTWKKLHTSDYLIIVLILVAIAALGFLEGIIIGLFVSIIIFVINYSRVEVIKYELTGKMFRSNVERSEHQKLLLEQHGNQIFILSLQGFIFFGSANQLLERVQMRIDTRALEPLQHLLFDFGHVTGLDSSAINSFNKLHVAAKKDDFHVLLCGLNEDMTRQLTVEGIIPDADGLVHTFVDLDHGLEWSENQLIQSVEQDTMALARLEEEDELHHIFDHIPGYLEDIHVPANTVLIEQGKAPGGIFFLESGQITVRLNSDTEKQMRLKTMGPGTVVGEVSLYLDAKASASVVTNVDCHIKYLSKENFQRLDLESPDKAIGLHIFVVRLLSDRLAKSNTTIQAMMR